MIDRIAKYTFSLLTHEGELKGLRVGLPDDPVNRMNQGFKFQLRFTSCGFRFPLSCDIPVDCQDNAAIIDIQLSSGNFDRKPGTVFPYVTPFKYDRIA